MGNHLSCDAVDMQDTVSRYVSGHLNEDDAAAFEQHMEGCERCWGEVQMALQVRAATRSVADRQGAAPRGTVLRRTWVAAAASLILASGAVWFVAKRETPTEITRGGNGVAITASRLPDGGIRLSWPAVDRAARYRVVVSEVDGTPMLTRDTDRPGLDLAPLDLPQPLPAALILELRAEDALGTRLVDQSPATVTVSAAPAVP